MTYRHRTFSLPVRDADLPRWARVIDSIAQFRVFGIRSIYLSLGEYEQLDRQTIATVTELYHCLRERHLCLRLIDVPAESHAALQDVGLLDLALARAA